MQQHVPGDAKDAEGEKQDHGGGQLHPAIAPQDGGKHDEGNCQGNGLTEAADQPPGFVSDFFGPAGEGLLALPMLRLPLVVLAGELGIGELPGRLQMPEEKVRSAVVELVVAHVGRLQGMAGDAVVVVAHPDRARDENH